MQCTCSLMLVRANVLASPGHNAKHFSHFITVIVRLIMRSILPQKSKHLSSAPSARRGVERVNESAKSVGKTRRASILIYAKSNLYYPSTCVGWLVRSCFRTCNVFVCSPSVVLPPRRVSTTTRQHTSV